MFICSYIVFNYVFQRLVIYSKLNAYLREQNGSQMKNTNEKYLQLKHWSLNNSCQIICKSFLSQLIYFNTFNVQRT